VRIAGGVVPLHNAVAGSFGSAVDAADAHNGTSAEEADRLNFYGPVYRRRGRGGGAGSVIRRF
jgi:hypothetical protein